ncbi:hypothetical protein L5515_003256 [Caenorhabditis briggsae]|uniref:Uncharacterized protein n=1 Tax=Caenorhabditis briggsae TaxID=6238 RepID=A0AAE9JBP3_CAEBR|nr:hypothetical protein L5515_003256 [Caenorhabditis briggsae]
MSPRDQIVEIEGAGTPIIGLNPFNPPRNFENDPEIMTEGEICCHVLFLCVFSLFFVIILSAIVKIIDP